MYPTCPRPASKLLHSKVCGEVFTNHWPPCGVGGAQTVGARTSVLWKITGKSWVLTSASRRPPASASPQATTFPVLSKVKNAPLVDHTCSMPPSSSWVFACSMYLPSGERSRLKSCRSRRSESSGVEAACGIVCGIIGGNRGWWQLQLLSE